MTRIKGSSFSSKLRSNVVYLALLLCMARKVHTFVYPCQTGTGGAIASQMHEKLYLTTVVETESSGSKNHSGAEATWTKARKIKSGKKASKLRKRKGPVTNPLTEDEISHHVAEVYGKMKSSEAMTRRRRNKSAQNALRKRENDAMDALINPMHAEHVKFLRQLDGHPALVLNADYQPLSYVPLSLWSWQDAVKAVFSGKVTVVETYDDVLIRAPSVDVTLPSVIALKEYVPTAYKTRPSFTRRNVFLRDGYKCQYCSERFSTTDLSLDHVVPRSRGGVLNWENAVSCCKRCNGKKGSLMPSELHSVGMKLIRQPRCPTQYELGMEKGKMAPKTCHPTWEPYLY